jgi:hypothetical protein
MSEEIRVRIAPSPSGNLHIGTARTALFNYFKCHTFPESNNGENTRKESYMYVDYSVSCNSARYKTHIAYAAVMILVYPCGSKWRYVSHTEMSSHIIQCTICSLLRFPVPLMYVALLYQHRDILRDQLKLDLEKEHNYPRIGHLVFLVGAYKPVMINIFILDFSNHLCILAPQVTEKGKLNILTVWCR